MKHHMRTRRNFLKMGSLAGAGFLCGCTASSETRALANTMSNHHTLDGFQNFPPIPKSSGLGLEFWWNRTKASFNSPVIPEDHYLPEKQALQNYDNLKEKNTLTWLGQNTFLLKINNKVILTDPFFDEYVDPFRTVKRFLPPGISQENLPPVDFIVLSHNHRDHLSEDVIELLPNKERIQVFVPLKMRPFFAKRGYSQIHELDWHESFSIGGIKITSLPAVHYSGRGLWDKNETLWCSWAIMSDTGKYYFSGDTAYSPTIFKMIGKDYGPFDLSMMTIGTYGNRKYGINNHANPEEAITMGLDIKTDISVGMHWGTIDLSEEPPWEPPERFRASAAKAGIPQEKTWIMKIGETRLLPGKKIVV